MNYLAHLHIAEHTKTSFSGNFLGDFVKGDPDGKFPTQIVEGIRLHRHIDSFVDKHPEVMASKLFFPKQLRRYAPIALDMVWDHYLALYWTKFHHLSLANFCQKTEQKIAIETAPSEIELPERFVRVNRWVWQDKWLESYQKMQNIEYALTRMSTRSQRMAPLAETGQVLGQHYEQLNAVFFELYDDVLTESKKFITK
jgi:acyl carrier protein phosphodiesterase